MLDPVFENGNLLRERHVGVLQRGDHHGKAVENTKKNAQHNKEQCERRIADTEQRGSPLQDPLRPLKKEQREGCSQPRDGIFNAYVLASHGSQNENNQESAKKGKNIEESFHARAY